MIARIFLGISLIIVVLFSIRLLRRTSGNSLLAWHTLLFTVVFDPAVYFIQFINYEFPSFEAGFVAYYDQTISDRLILSLVLVNLIIIPCLLIFERNISRSVSSKQEAPHLFGPVPFVFYIGIIVVVLGLISYLASDMAEVILDSGLETMGDYDAYYEVRFEAGQAGMTGLQQHFHNFSLITLLPILALYSLQRYLLERKRNWAVTWGALMTLWVIVSVLQLAKFYIVNVAVTNLIAVILVLRLRSDSRKSSFLWVAAGAFVAFMVVNLVYQVLGAATSPLQSLLLLFERFVAIPVHTTWNHFVVFPDLYPHTHYTTSRTLNLILAGGMAGGPRDMMPYHIVSAILTGRAYNMNTGFVGSGWAEMGYFGVVQAAFLIFGTLLLWDTYLIKKAKVIPLAALIAFFLGKIWNIHNGDLSFLFLSGGLLLGPAFYIILFYRELQMKLPLIRPQADIAGLKTRSPREPVVQPSSTLAPPGRYRR